MNKFKNKLQIINSNAFTLAEILVVLGVLAVMLVLLTEVFFNSLRGGNKTQIISSLNENGRVIMDMIDKNVKGADAIICPAFARREDTSVESRVLVTLKSGVFTRYRFVLPTDSTNGKIVRDNPAPEAGDEAENPNVFINEVCNIADIQSANEIDITDINPTSGVSIVEGQFIRNRNNGFKDTVMISFDLQPGVKSSNRIPGRIDTVNFTTTIEVR